MRFNRLDEWLDWQSRLHLKNIDLGLERVSRVWQSLYPDTVFPACVITVAGTNGKGSSVAMLEAILLAAGYRVGCYTSPHLLRYNERIRIDGKEATDDSICEAFQRIDQAREQISLTYFEFGTLAALDIFTRQKLDVVILEVGLGGRLDAVNIIDADLALITGIDIDHSDWLGDSRELIGAEKAGILRAGQVAVFSGADMPTSIHDKAISLELDMAVAGEDFHWQNELAGWRLTGRAGNRNGLPVPAMRGDHQFENAAGVIQLLLEGKSKLPVSSDAMRQGLLSAQVAGRFQVIPAGGYRIVVDVAHNQQSMSVLAQNLKKFVIKGRLHAITGMLRDKDIKASLVPLLDVVDAWYIVPTPGERGLAANVFMAKLLELKPEANCRAYETLAEARASVLQFVTEDDTLLVTGSFLVAGEFLAELQPREPDVQAGRKTVEGPPALHADQ